MIEDTSRETNVENDQLHQPVNDVSKDLGKGGDEESILPFTTHQRPNGRRFTPVESSKSRGDRTSTEFSNVSRGADGNCVPPDNARVEQTEVGRKARESEVLSKRSATDNNARDLGRVQEAGK